MAYTVKQLAQLAGVSVRTLHHYDEIGLLTPTVIGANGYRYYDERSALRLQSIRFYRELDFPLETIKAVLDRPDFDPLAALQEQRVAIEMKLGRLHRLIATIDQTISHLKTGNQMNSKKLFAGFTPEEEERYTKEAAKRWDPATVQASQRKWKSFTAAQKDEIKVEGEAIYHGLLATMRKGAAAQEVQGFIARWHRHLQYFWSPNDDQLIGLADLYHDDPAFRQTYDAIDPRLAPFMREAVKVYVDVRRRAMPANPVA